MKNASVSTEKDAAFIAVRPSDVGGLKSFYSLLELVYCYLGFTQIQISLRVTLIQLNGSFVAGNGVLVVSSLKMLIGQVEVYLWEVIGRCVWEIIVNIGY